MGNFPCGALDCLWAEVWMLRELLQDSKGPICLIVADTLSWCYLAGDPQTLELTQAVKGVPQALYLELYGLLREAEVFAKRTSMRRRLCPAELAAVEPLLSALRSYLRWWTGTLSFDPGRIESGHVLTIRQLYAYAGIQESQGRWRPIACNLAILRLPYEARDSRVQLLRGGDPAELTGVRLATQAEPWVRFLKLTT